MTCRRLRLAALLQAVDGRQDDIGGIATRVRTNRRGIIDSAAADAVGLGMLVICCRPILGGIGAAPLEWRIFVDDQRIGRMCGVEGVEVAGVELVEPCGDRRRGILGRPGSCRAGKMLKRRPG